MTSTNNNTEPSAEVATKYGVLTLTFVDPAWTETADRYGQRTAESDVIVARAEGTLVIRGIAVRVQTRLVYANRFHDKGQHLETPIREFRQHYASSYNRRLDTATGYSAGEVTPGARDVIRTICETTLRATYEARPDLQHAAKRFRLASLLETATRARDEAYATYKASEEALTAALHARNVFDEAR